MALTGDRRRANNPAALRRISSSPSTTNDSGLRRLPTPSFLPAPREVTSYSPGRAYHGAVSRAAVLRSWRAAVAAVSIPAQNLDVKLHAPGAPTCQSPLACRRRRLRAEERMPARAHTPLPGHAIPDPFGPDPAFVLLPHFRHNCDLVPSLKYNVKLAARLQYLE